MPRTFRFGKGCAADLHFFVPYRVSKSFNRPLADARRSNGKLRVPIVVLVSENENKLRIDGRSEEKPPL
jgi:hypothetical protein